MTAAEFARRDSGQLPEDAAQVEFIAEAAFARDVVQLLRAAGQIVPGAFDPFGLQQTRKAFAEQLFHHETRARTGEPELPCEVFEADRGGRMVAQEGGDPCAAFIRHRLEQPRFEQMHHDAVGGETAEREKRGH